MDNKLLLSIKEAAQYSGIGINTIRELTRQKDCNFVLFIGNKTYIKREKFKEFIDNAKYI